MQCPLVVCCLLAEWPDTSFQGRLLNEITNAGENEMATQRSVLADFRRADAEGIGARFFRADLHFHTPASSDARGANRYGFNPYKLTYPTKQQQQADPLAVHNFQQGILDDARALATSMVQRFLEESLSIVAITDHNGIGTIWSDVQSRSFMDLRAPTWYELVDEAARAHNELVGFFSQAHSLRRVVLFCMVIIMEEFGPAVIDAPEAHFDNQDILRYLLPIIRMYKDTRQIVLFSTNPVLAVNTDPDNYLLLETKGTRFRRILSGFAIDDDKRRPRLLEVIEGGMASFRKRAASYQAPDL